MKNQSTFAFVFLCFLIISCKRKTPLFQLVPSDYSNIHFNNHIVENDTVNPFDLPNMYNGAGVGIGDFNNDGLPDIYFAGNQVPCRLYLNKGNFKFEDVTDIALDVMRHRIVLSYEAMAEELSADEILGRIMRSVPAPNRALHSHVRVSANA